MAKRKILSQVVAVVKAAKPRIYAETSALHKQLQKPALFVGFSKEFVPKEEGDSLPPESHRVQARVSSVFEATARGLTELFHLTAQVDWTNCVAKGDVVVDDQTLFSGAPVSFLLFLEKQLTDLRSMIAVTPILDENHEWKPDPNSGLMRTDPTSTHRTKKTQRPIVLYNATPEHPAQTQLLTEDVIQGYWNTAHLSGAMSRTERDAFAERVERLLVAVKEARTLANAIEVVDVPDVANAVFTYLLPPKAG